MFPLGSSQDQVKEAIRNKMDKLALTSGLRMGRYIGAEGEHFTPETFAKMGFQNSEPYRGTEFHIAPNDVAKILTVLKHEVLLSVHRGTCQMYEFWFSQMSQLNDKVVNLHNECTRLNTDIDNLKNSTSWRITALFRKIDKAINSYLKKS